MAIAATIEWEVRTTATANNANGGGFKPGASGTDYSQQDAAQYNLTGVTTAAADAILLDANAAAAMVGNIAHIVSGTNFTVGWYEIISVVVGTSITLDRTCTTAAGAAGVVNIGGALSLGHSTDDSLFESLEPGNIVHIKVGSYSPTSISMAKVGTSSLPITLRGYNAARNDAPTGANRPTLAFGANTSSFANYVNQENIEFTTTTFSGTEVRSDARAVNCKSTNSSVTAGRPGFYVVNGSLIGCEAVSTNGNAVNVAASNSRISYCYIHDSSTGIALNTTSVNSISKTIIETISATGISIGSGATDHTVSDVTMYGAATPAGSSIGINLAATTGINHHFENIIISGFVDPIISAAVVGSNSYRYINIHNCTNAVTNVTLDEGSATDDPGFVDAPNGNFAVGTNMKATGGPATFPGGLTANYLDRGAVQRIEPTGGSSGGARIMINGSVSGG